MSDASTPTPPPGDAPSAAPPPAPTCLEHTHRHAFAIGMVAWALAYTLIAWSQTAGALLDLARLGIEKETWKVASWEWSSAIVAWALVPLIAAAERRWPLAWGSLRRHLALHALASLAYCGLHVVGMVAIREAVYAWHGQDYDFGDWPRELAYEYLKDWRSYAIVLTIQHYAGLWMRRARGEAVLLGAPDDAPPPAADAPPERPERFLVRKLGREFLVAADDIEYAVAAGNYVNLHVRGRDYPLRSTTAGLEEKLDPARFVRVHRSVLVRLDQVASIEPLESGDARLHMADGATLPCSRRHRAALRERAG
jgi:hypothetical protein